MGIQQIYLLLQKYIDKQIGICMIVPKKSIGLIVLLFMPFFAVGQNCMDSIALRQDSIDIRTDSLRQRNAMYNCDTVRKDSFPKQHRLFFVRKEQGLTRGISPNAVKMQKFDPYKKKFTDMRIIETIGSHISR
jgi:hypothetical protein